MNKLNRMFKETVRAPFNVENGMLVGSEREYESRNQLIDEQPLISTGDFIADHDDATDLLMAAVHRPYSLTASNDTAQKVVDAVLTGDHTEAGRLMDKMLRDYALHEIESRGISE